MRTFSRLINFIFSVHLVLVSPRPDSGNHDCPVEWCPRNIPEVRFPFRLKDRQPEQCGYPGFELYCSHQGDTVLELELESESLSSSSPNQSTHSIKFIVQYIDYFTQTITLSNINGCFGELLPQLNYSSSSPFWFDDTRDDYTFFSCPSVIRPLGHYMMFIPVPCLSNSTSHHVYAVSSYQSVYTSRLVLQLSSCTKIFRSSSYILSTFSLKWSKPSCRHCEMRNKHCRLKNNNKGGNSSITNHTTECFLPVYEDGLGFPSRQPQEEDSGSLRKKIIEGVVIGPSLLGLVVTFAVYLRFKRKEEDQKRIEKFLEDHKALRPTRYTYADIKKIANQFKEKLGQGGYGTVYKGKLNNEILVAVKVLDNFKGNGDEFINEVNTIGRIHHVNVVRLVGYCADGYRRCLVYEFLPNESLEKIISSENQIRSLGWEKLQKIACGIAKGLDYLHQGCNQRILHFDVKPQNILLDEKFNPKVADFGLAKLCAKEQSKVSMTAARGTIGYIAPEVFSRSYGNVSYKADIYSFGMLLLNMVGGRKKFPDTEDDSNEIYFPEWMYNQLERGEDITIQIDRHEDDKIIRKLSVVGLWCIQWYPGDRPSMKVVIQMMEGEAIPIMPPNPFASMKSSAANGPVPRSRFHNDLEIISEED